MRVQLISVPPYEPPPRLLVATLPARMQLETTEVSVSQYTPAPLLLTNPLDKVNPNKAALLTSDTHRMVFRPSITVTCGPLTLRTVTILSTATRLTKVFVPTGRPPVE